MRVCKGCHCEKPEDQFASAGVVKGKRYHRHVCKTCYWKAKKPRRDRHAIWLREIKAMVGCRCGERDHRCLDFDHIDPSTKLFSLGDVQGLGKSKKIIIAEMAKCQVICANCHRKKTWNEQHKLEPKVDQPNEI